MTNGGNVENFIESMLDDRAPQGFSADPEDSDVVQVAIALRALQGEWAWPAPQFVESLHQRLAGISQPGADLVPFPADAWLWGLDNGRRPVSIVPPGQKAKMPRPLSTVGKAAAAALLVAGAFGGARLADGHIPTRSAHVATAGAVRSGELLAADGRQLGETYAYRGSPSWVFMDVKDSGLAGTYTCVLRLANGSNITAGILVVYNGSGEWAHTVNVDASQLRNATVESSAGEVVATAVFS